MGPHPLLGPEAQATPHFVPFKQRKLSCGLSALFMAVVWSGWEQAWGHLVLPTFSSPWSHRVVKPTQALSLTYLRPPGVGGDYIASVFTAPPRPELTTSTPA